MNVGEFYLFTAPSPPQRGVPPLNFTPLPPPPPSHPSPPLRLSSNGLHMSTHDIDILTSHFDVDGLGHMNIEAFILGMRGSLNARRLSIVEKAFNTIAEDGEGWATVEGATEMLNVDMMPEVRRGTLTPIEGAKEFVRRLEGTTGIAGGKITKEEFVDYYSWLGCSVIDDDTFVGLVETAWRVKERDVGEDR